MSQTPARRRRTLLAVPAVALAASLALTACVPVQRSKAGGATAGTVTTVAIGDQQIREGGDLVMALSAEPDRLDPTTSSSLYTRYVMETMCQKLYDIDAEGTVVPMLATELPTVSDGGKTVTFPVHTGYRFADGTPFDADAVVTTLERNLTKDDSSRKSEMGPVTAIDAVDDHTVRIRYATPFAPITAALADRAGMVMSPTALAQEGDGFGDAPVCIGPYKFVERVPQTSITVERDPMYHDPASAHFDRITYRIITDASIRAQNLKSGDVQVADTISTQDVDELMERKDLSILRTGSLGYQGITINLANQDGVGTDPKPLDTPLATQRKVRQALSMSINRAELVQSVFRGWADVACSPIPDTSAYATDASKACPEYDPERAKELLEQAGVQQPFPIEMEVTNTPDTVRFAQALQAQARAGGFAITITPVEYTTLLDDQTRGDFQALQLGWSGRVDPHGNIGSFLGTGGGNNYPGYSDPEVDDLIARASQATDQQERADLYGQLVTKVQQDDPIIYLYRTRSITGVSTDVAGVSTYADGVVRLSQAAFVEGGSK
ncbi:ABC transporter substrate-binding protein [Curtobacterium sp. SGAir0471]|uniref:ABC transporter substrate-binding protein n=1 Tax=Curtobacterium sp. SGAir0471 TaxID=2070337 RepID=UPI0010CCC4F8|nr:ABC transporter substrate-binding protein [Curtobacterium sp. SGAir0471]QCR42366.1 ABC transporter substrate-binding protein [Curtobacterium sp. SGAir0471]